MVEKPIKVDEETDRVVTDLAHFLRSTKKSVVRDAVAEYAESRHALMPTHVGKRGAGERGAGESNPIEEGTGVDGLTPLQRLGLRRKGGTRRGGVAVRLGSPGGSRRSTRSCSIAA